MEKEERRRKIMSRGTDRMALITGRMNTLDQDPISKSSSFSVTRLHDHHPPPQHARSSSEPVAIANDEALLQYNHHHSPHGGYDARGTVMKHDNVEEVPKGHPSRSRDSDLQKLEQKEAATFRSDNAYLPEKQWDNLIGSITAREITFSIVSSEDIRAVCSVVLGFLVVLSHVSLPQDVIKPKSLIAYRPLYIVLLTDMLIVAARLAPYAHIRKEDKMRYKIEEDEHDLGGAVKYLELGLVLHQTFRALFMDCSLYLVVVVFGLSLV